MILTYINFTGVIFPFFCTYIHIEAKYYLANRAVLGKFIFERPNKISQDFSYANMRKGKTALQTE